MVRRAVIALVGALLAMVLSAGCAAREPADEPAATHQHGETHQHADMSPTDVLLLVGDAVLVVVVLGLLIRRPRVRARAEGRWRLPAAAEDDDSDDAERG